MVVRSLAPTLEARNIHHYLFFVKGGQTCQKSEKKQRTNKQQTVLFSRRFVSEGQGTNNKGRLLDLTGVGGLSNHEKKRLEEEHHYYYVTRGQERDAASTHNKKKKKKVSLLPTHQTRKKEELVNKRIVVVVAVVRVKKHFDRLLFQKKV